jgi:hypothetical protein
MTALLPAGWGRLQEDFFTEHDMLVVVWERHLEQYLKDSLLESRFGDVPVQYYDDWLNQRLRRVVPIGEYHIEDGNADLEAEKRMFTEKELGDWIQSWDRSGKALVHPVAAAAYGTILDFLDGARKTHGLVATTDRADENWEVLATTFDRARYRFNETGVDTVIDRVKAGLDTLARNCDHPVPIQRDQPVPTVPRASQPEESLGDRRLRRARLQAAIPVLQEELVRLREKLHTAVKIRYPLLLLKFYEWGTDRSVRGSSFAAADREAFLDGVRKKLEGKKLSRTDRVLILWLIKLMAERAQKDQQEPDESLPDYAHVMIDEAQQYDPLVLRLFCRLSRSPFSSVTLVGALRQRLREDGGVVMWDDLDLAIPEERRARLLVNYRWAKETFQALRRLVDVLELPDIELKEPLRWPAGIGIPTQYLVLVDSEEELNRIVGLINNLRSRQGAEHWSIAVLLPDEYAAWRERLVDLLGSIAINTDWTVGANVRAGKEGVTLTNAKSVVGLEFDAVFIVGAQHLLPAAATEVQLQRFWVMATRARQHLCVTSCGQVPRLAQWLS